MEHFLLMKISDLSIISIVPFVLGVDNTPSYKGGPKIVELFNAVGFRDDYWVLNSKGLFGARKDFVKNKLLEINGKNQLKEFIEMLVDDRQNHEPDKTAKLLDFLHKSFFIQFNCLSFTQSKLYMPASKLNRRFNLLRRFLYTQDKILKHFILPNTCST